MEEKLGFENFPYKKEWLERAGVHSDEAIPEDERHRLIFALLEAIDFQCFEFGDCPKEPSEKEIKIFLKDNKEEILKSINPPSYLGALGGAFNFLLDD